MSKKTTWIVVGGLSAAAGITALVLYLRQKAASDKQQVGSNPLSKMNFQLAKFNVKRELDAKNVKTLREAFEACDANHDGQVSRVELLKALKTNPAVRKLLRQNIVDLKDFPQFGEVFDKMDRDGSGSLTWDEFVLYFADAKREALHSKIHSVSGDLMHKLRLLFDSCDANKDGEVDRKELTEAMSKMEAEFDAILPLNAVSFEEVFDAIDKDHNDKISWPEFCMYFVKGGKQVQKEIERSWIRKD
jgi:Ca2+-binding EF-hand superfamily protein